MKSKIRPFFFALLACLMIGCASGHLTPSTQHSENNTTIIRDTFLLHDSVFIDRYQNVYIKGDSVIVEREVTKYRDRFRYKTVHDTTLVTKTDTIMVDVPVEKVVETTPRILLYSLALNVAIIAFCIWRIWKRWKH